MIYWLRVKTESNNLSLFVSLLSLSLSLSLSVSLSLSLFLFLSTHMQEKTRAQLKEFEDIVKKDLERYNKVVECMCVRLLTMYMYVYLQLY